MAEAITRLFLDKKLRQELGANGSEYIVKHYNRKTIAERFEKLLLAVKASTLDVSDDGNVQPNLAAEDSSFVASTVSVPQR